MRRLLWLLMLSVATAMLLAASEVAAAQEDVGPTDRPPLEEVDDIGAVDGGVVGEAPSDQAPSDQGTVVAEEDPDIISTDPVDYPAHHPVNKDPGTNDDPSTVENPKTGNTPMDEEASGSGDVKSEAMPEGIATTAP